MKCKYVERNQAEQKCSDYYDSHNPKHDGRMCRLKEWKHKKGVCPYDKTIYSQSNQSKNQTTLK